MPGPITIPDGKLIEKDPANISLYNFNWDGEHLAVGVTIITSTFTIIEQLPYEAWSLGVDYVAGDYAVELGVIYVCILAHTDFVPPNATYWAVAGTVVALTKDAESILVGNRKTQLRLTGGTYGQTYRINNKIVSSETPAQTKERSFFVLIQDQ